MFLDLCRKVIFMIKTEDFKNFTVYHEDDSYQFCYITIKDESFFTDFASYILDFDMIKKHAAINLDVNIELTLRDYNEILNRLISFADFEKIYNTADFDDAVIEILNQEYIHEESDLRKDKWGRIGEYIFNILLDSFFNLDCIIRKFALNTSRNMPVYGIDTVHCSLEDKTFYFGESKMVDSIDNGINLIIKSLESYEAQISAEYYTIKNNNFTRSDKFMSLFEESLNRCLTFGELISYASINTIGIPIFISHGGTYDTTNILNKMKKIPSKKIFDLDTKYFFISVPVLNKEKFRTSFLEVLNKKIEECKTCIRETV